MKLYRSATAILFVSMFSSMACSSTSVPPASSPAGALSANSALTNPVPMPFEKHNLNSGSYLNQFLRPEVRAKLDEEPTGDSDASFDPAAADTGAPSDQPQTDSAGDGQSDTSENAPAPEADESFRDGTRLDTLKFAWARKAFGDAVQANPTNTGVIVVYADENYFELERLIGYVEEGRDKIASASKIGGERLQVVFGGYRAAPQVEMWIIPQGGAMPEFKPEDRPKAE